MTIALIDGDLVAYRCAASAEKDDADIAMIRANRTLQDMVSVTGANDIKLFLSGSRNFRYDLFADYKANRKDMVRPRHLEFVREFLVIKWGANVTDGYEADDAIGINASSETIVCSIDKDLKQIPGIHYNFVNGEYSEVSVNEGWRNFYKQLLTGDRADNIPGVGGIGKVKSARHIGHLNDPAVMYDVVRHLYNNDQLLVRNGSLLYIWRKENDQLGWLPTKVATTSEREQEAVMKLESILTKRVENTPSTERGGTKPKADGSPRRGRSKATRSPKTKLGR